LNGAEGISDIEGKAVRVTASKLGNERVSIVTSAYALRRPARKRGTEPVTKLGTRKAFARHDG
jgi:hypothetical protein